MLVRIDTWRKPGAPDSAKSQSPDTSASVSPGSVSDAGKSPTMSPPLGSTIPPNLLPPPITPTIQEPPASTKYQASFEDIMSHHRSTEAQDESFVTPAPPSAEPSSPATLPTPASPYMPPMDHTVPNKLNALDRRLRRALRATGGLENLEELDDHTDIFHECDAFLISMSDSWLR